MAIGTVDSTKVVHEALVKTGTDLYTLIGARAFSPVAPVPSVWNNSTPAVIFRETNISPPACDGAEFIDVQFRCYGGTQSYTDARTVYRALRDRLVSMCGETLTTGRVSRVFVISGRQEPLEPDTGWPCYVVNCRIILS